MTAIVRSRPGGWSLALACTAALIAGCTAIYLAYEDPVEGIRRVIRVTAHSSLVLFLLAFTASSLQAFWAGRATHWLRRNRRQFGVAFAASHFIHAVAIIALVRTDALLFWQLSGIPNIVAGGSAYLVLLALLVTSFDGPAPWLGRTAWLRLHGWGVWYLWLVFMITNGKRIATGPGFAFTVGLLVLAAGLKIVAKIHARRGATPY
jgi:DMSO/TMAO reductase YedYZ heme-binding membrane subunit